MLKDLIIPICILAVIASVVLPLPAALIDFMLVGNVILALVLLVSTLYISDPLKLSSLPSILLLTTLYRLALNISTTRLILSTGNAGSLIEAFGEVVIQGQVIVGLVIFLVITLIQFIVIAKGSERVAEVSARFTLDALPGKQMSIDADVRSGLINIQEAKIKRQDLQTESRFYGALDGAMKFVKGDAIAGIIITAINIIGGLSIGVLVNNIDIGTAASQYTLLTIGDGLLSQIPALLNSLAAGMIVTRVVRGDDNSLTRELLSQVSQVKIVLFLVGIVSIILAFLPGLPTLPFLTLSGILFYSANSQTEKDLDGNKQDKIIDHPKIPDILKFEFGKKIAEKLIEDNYLDKVLSDLKNYIFNENGLLIKIPACSIQNESDNQVFISLRNIKIYTLTLNIEENDWKNKFITEMQKIILENSKDFLNNEHTKRIINYFEEVMPELTSNLIPEIISITKITKIFKFLNEENVSIQQLDVILQAIAEQENKVSNERWVLEEIRIALGRYIANELAVNNKIENVFNLAPEIDLHFAKVERDSIEIDLELLNFVKEMILNNNCNILITSRASRRLIFECLKLHNINIPVIAYEEIPDNYSINIIHRISLDNNDLSNKIIEEIAA